MHEETKRSGLKAISWRIIATSTGMLLVYYFTGQWETMAEFGIGDVVLKLLFYFLHERAWNKTEYGRSLGGKVSSVMRSPPVISLYSDNIQSIIQKMVTLDIGAVIVADEDKPIGIITERDIIEWELTTSEDPNQKAAREIMSSPITTVEQDTSLTEALKLMHDKHIRRLAVTQEDKILGVISERRILAALV
jgi:predicted transcriptional regulator